MKLQAAVPILRSFSEAKAREFYVDFLGFAVDWEHRFAPDLPLYLQIRRGDLTLHLSEHHGDAAPGTTLYIRMEGIDALHAELNAKQYGNARPGLQRVDWGRTMEIADPFGNRLRFCEETPA